MSGLERIDPSVLLSELMGKGKYVFTHDDVKAAVGGDSVKASRLIGRLVKRGLARRIKRGVYILSPKLLRNVSIEVVMAALMNYGDYYLGLYTALRIWRMTESIIVRHFIITKKVYSPKVLELNGYIVEVLTVKEGLFFGIVRIPINTHIVNVSDAEKTLLDCLYFPEKVSVREVAKAISRNLNKLDVEKLTSYALRLRKPSIIQRLGFLLERAGADESHLRELRKLVSRRYFKLDPMGSDAEVSRDRKWRIIVNVKLGTGNGG